MHNSNQSFFRRERTFIQGQYFNKSSRKIREKVGNHGVTFIGSKNSRVFDCVSERLITQQDRYKLRFVAEEVTLIIPSKLCSGLRRGASP